MNQAYAWKVAVACVLAGLLLAAATFAIGAGPGTPDNAAAQGTASTPTATRTPRTSPTPTRTPTPGPREHTVFVPLAATDGPRVPLPAVLPCNDSLLAPVNKQHRLHSGCVPPDLEPVPESFAVLFEDPELFGREPALDALTSLIHAAWTEGVPLFVRSAYRSYDHQAFLFDYWVETLGLERAEATSARAGHSEHQLGTAFDLTTPDNGYDFEGFEDTLAGRWVAANATRFGFVLSYPAGKQHMTGYEYEPWHIRYIGLQAAEELAATNLTLHEWLILR